MRLYRQASRIHYCSRVSSRSRGLSRRSYAQSFVETKYRTQNEVLHANPELSHPQLRGAGREQPPSGTDLRREEFMQKKKRPCTPENALLEHSHCSPSRSSLLYITAQQPPLCWGAYGSSFLSTFPQTDGTMKSFVLFV